jgi:GNAT superfamily N-acetyltransferase
MLDQLTQTDGWNHLASGAERVNADGSGGEGLGVARFVRLADAPETAEAAVAVVDEVQGRGLGRLLLTLLVEAACERGIRRFRAYVLPSNAPMRSVIRELDPQAAPRQEDGVLVYDVALPAASRAAVVQSPLYRLLRTAAAGLTTVWRGRPPAGGGSRS